MHTARLTLDQGIHFEKNGNLRKALALFTAAATSATNAIVAAEAMRRKSHVLRRTCAWQEALAAARMSAELAIRAEQPDLFAEALNAEAGVYLSRGDFAAARPLLEQILRVTGDDRIAGIALQNLGTIAAMAREFDVARERFLSSRERFARAGYRRGEAMALNNGAAILNDQGEYAAALALAEQAMIVARDVDDYATRAVASLNLAQALAGTGRYAEAEELASQAFGLFGIEGDRYRQIGCLRLLGDINRLQGSTANAIRCYERGLKLAETIDASIERGLLEDRLSTLAGVPAA